MTTRTLADLPFGHLRIHFDERVLRPRPWTAAQSRWAAALLADAPDGPALELCSGAGQIGLLAVSLAPRPLVCVDANPAACDFARANAAAAGLEALVEVRHGRLEEALSPDERFALILADPPWVPRADTGRFPEDPVLAIDGGDDGLDLAWSCVAVAARHLLPGGSVLLQLGHRRQAEAIGAAAASYDLALVETRTYDGGVVVRLDPA